jgi:hypothetical protein
MSGIARRYIDHPTYFDDFWTRPGYAGADRELTRSLIDATSTIERFVTVSDFRGAVDTVGRNTSNIPLNPASTTSSARSTTGITSPKACAR